MKTFIRDEVFHSNVVAIADNKGNKITYRGLEERAEKLSEWIRDRSLIFVFCDHTAETAEFIYEMLYLNRVPFLLPDDIEWELVEQLIERYQPQYIYCGREYKACCEYRYRIEFVNHVVLHAKEKKTILHPDLAILLSTSGTTGSPKLVKLSYQNLYCNAEQICRHTDMKREQKGISPLSMSYVYGLNFCLWHWHCGATLLITDEPVLSNQFREFYEKEKANHFAGTPYLYQILRKIRFWDTEKLEYLHWAMSAGSQMSDSDQVWMVERMKDKFWITYGQTESTGVITGMNFHEQCIRLGTIGRVMGNTEATISSQTNELILKGETVCMGYANTREELAEGDMNHGILRTGDVAYMDEDKCIYLRGRLTRYVKILGKRVSLDDVEKYLDKKFSEAEFVCTGKDEQLSVYFTERKKDVYVENTDILLEIEKEAPKLLDQNMKIPRKFIACKYIKEIPRNLAGKIMYTVLEDKGSGRENKGTDS